MNRMPPLVLGFVVVSVLALHGRSGAQSGSDAQCTPVPESPPAGAPSPSPAAQGPQCGPDDYAPDSAPKWYVILTERTRVFCDYYFDQAIHKRPWPALENNQFRIRGFGKVYYVYTPAEVQSLMRYCGDSYRQGKKAWEESHPPDPPPSATK